MSFDWYPWYVQAWRKNTMHLGLAEDGAYRRLIDEYMMTRAALLDNDSALARIIGVSKDEWMAVAATVRPFFKASNGKLFHERCEEELMAQLKQRHSHAIAGALGAEKRWGEHRRNKNNNSMLSQPHSGAIATPMANDSTRQDKDSSGGENAPLARSPNGELRGAPGKQQVSNALRQIVAAKGWGN